MLMIINRRTNNVGIVLYGRVCWVLRPAEDDEEKKIARNPLKHPMVNGVNWGRLSIGDGLLWPFSQ